MKSSLNLTLILLLILQTPLFATSKEFFEFIQKNQILMAEAKPIEAQKELIKWENEHPEIRKNPIFCYQRFFVALEGLGDRETAKIMLQRLEYLVDSGRLSPTSSIYRSVTQAWNKALLHADSDLPRQAHRIMQARLEMNAKHQ